MILVVPIYYKLYRSRSRNGCGVLSCFFTVVRCPMLNTLYASVNSTDTEFGVTVNISCFPGHLIGGQTTVTVHCTGTGQWSLNASCERKHDSML